MNAFTNRDFLRSVALFAVAGVAGIVVALLVTTPPQGILLPLAVYSAAALALALALPPHLFVAAALVVVGISTAFGSAIVSFGPATFYVADLAVLVIFVRGLVPRARERGPRALVGVPQLLFVIWLGVLALAAARGTASGIPMSSVIRGDLALFYWPLLYFGFSRVLAEKTLDRDLLWRSLTVVAVGFIGYMFVARALNHPFQDVGLADVPTGEGESVARNFGFASAFTIYPVVAIAAVAARANSRHNQSRWTVLAGLGVLATLTTLVRGEIFALILGLLVVLWLTPSASRGGDRAGTFVKLAFAGVASLIALLAIDPKLGQAVIQRTVPFTTQAPEASANADYRFKAMETGLTTARRHPAGLGVLDRDALEKRQIDPGYLAHSGFAILLVFGGWPALAAAVLTLLAVIRRSFTTPAPWPWLHPAFVGAVTMLSVYSLSAAGLVGDPWVMPLGVLLVALRFSLRSESP
jgi:hypothetical protein